MKDHKKTTKQVYDLDGQLEGAIATLREAAEGMIDPVLEMENWDGYTEILVTGWVPLTKEEIKYNKDQAKKKREAAKRKKEQDKEDEYNWLVATAEKLGYKLEERSKK